MPNDGKVDANARKEHAEPPCLLLPPPGCCRFRLVPPEGIGRRSRCCSSSVSRWRPCSRRHTRRTQTREACLWRPSSCVATGLVPPAYRSLEFEAPRHQRECCPQTPYEGRGSTFALSVFNAVVPTRVVVPEHAICHQREIWLFQLRLLCCRASSSAP